MFFKKWLISEPLECSVAFIVLLDCWILPWKTQLVQKTGYGQVLAPGAVVCCILVDLHLWPALDAVSPAPGASTTYKVRVSVFAVEWERGMLGFWKGFSPIWRLGFKRVSLGLILGLGTHYFHLVIIIIEISLSREKRFRKMVEIRNNSNFL
jgi:hypothetical protein